MTSTKLKATRLIAPVLLASSAFLVACGKSPSEDLKGMADSMAGVCPINNVTPDDKLKCAEQGERHGLALVKYAGLEDRFKGATTLHSTVVPGAPADIMKIINASAAASRAQVYLGAVEGAAKDDYTKEVARNIRNTMVTTLKAR